MIKKKSIYFLSILILFQSCYSYKTYDINVYQATAPKKVKVELIDSRKLKGKIIQYKKESLIIETMNKTIEIPFLKIKTIKRRKFSYFKLYITGLAVSVTLLVIVFKELIKGTGEASVKGIR